MRVNNPEYADHGETGRVAIVDLDTSSYWVWLDFMKWPMAYEEEELELFYPDPAQIAVQRRIGLWTTGKTKVV